MFLTPNALYGLFLDCDGKIVALDLPVGLQRLAAGAGERRDAPSGQRKRRSHFMRAELFGRRRGGVHRVCGVWAQGLQGDC